MIAGRLTIGQFVLFNTILLQLAWPLEALGWILNLGPARARVGGPHASPGSSGVQRLPEPERAADAARRPARRSRSTGVHFAYAGEEEVLRGVDLARRPGEIVAVCGGTGVGQDARC